MGEVTDIAPKQLERYLREAGVPRAFAKLVVSVGFAEAQRRLSAHQREVEGEGLDELVAALRRTADQIQSWTERTRADEQLYRAEGSDRRDRPHLRTVQGRQR